MAENKNLKIRMKVSRGNPAGGPIIRAGATVEISEFWALRFIDDGTAELTEDQSKNKAVSKAPKVKK